MTDWHSEVGKVHGQNWIDWFGHLSGTPAQGLELGTYVGESAEVMLDHVFTHPEARYHCVDHFRGSAEHVAAGDDGELEKKARERLLRFAPRAQIFKSDTVEAMRGMYRNDRFDLIYVDADHHALSVLRDSMCAWDLLKPGGHLMWDDYGWRAMPDEADRPQPGIDAFLYFHQGLYKMLVPPSAGVQVVVQKK